MTSNKYTYYRIAGIFRGRGKIFVSSEFWAKFFRGPGTLNHTPGTMWYILVFVGKNFVVRFSTTKILPPEKYPLYGSLNGCMCVYVQCTCTYRAASVPRAVAHSRILLLQAEASQPRVLRLVDEQVRGGVRLGAAHGS